MKRLALFTVVALLAGCGTKLTPRERYVQALNQRLEGNAKGYTDGLIAVAHEAPDSRAGKRARATLQGGGLMTGVAVVGVLAAIAIPNFIKFQARSKQSEVKTNLKAIYVTLKSYYAEKDKYCTSFQQCGFQPESGSRYLYFLGPKEVVGGDAVVDRAALRKQAEDAMRELGVRSSVGKSGFLVVGAGDPDNDGNLDIWSIDDQNSLINLMNDID
jgi:type IV pilus assembly protein PilA